MSKKIVMFIFSVLIMIVTSVFSVFLEYQRIDTYWKNFGKSNSSFPVYLYNFEGDGEDVIDVFSEICNKYQVNLYRDDYVRIDEKTVNVKSVLSTYNSQTLNKIPLEKDGYLEYSNDFPKQTFTTGNYSDTSDLLQDKKKIYSFLNKQFIKIQPLQQFALQGHKFNGTYTAEIKNNLQKNEFLEELSQGLGLEKESLSKQQVQDIASDSTITPIVIVIIILFFMMFLLFAFYYTYQNYKKVGLCKLCGHSSMYIWVTIFVPIFLAQLITMFVITLSSIILTNISRTGIIGLIGYNSAGILLTMLVSIILYFPLQNYTISSLIKNKKPFKTIINVNLALKSIMLICTCAILFTTVDAYSEVDKQYKKYKAWDKYGSDYAVFDTSFYKEDHADIINRTHIREKKMLNFYKDLSDDGSILISSQEFIVKDIIGTYDENENKILPKGYDSKQMSTKFDSYDSYMVNINQNYLDDFPIKDTNGNNIKINTSESGAIYLVPDKFKNDDKMLNIFFADYRKNSIANEKSYMGESLVENVNENFSIIYYRSGLEIFGFNTRINSDSDYMISDPLFQVITKENSLFTDISNCIFSGIDSGIKIDIRNGSTSEIFEKYSELIEKNGLTNNITKLVSIDSLFLSEITYIKQYIFIILTIAIILLIVSILMSMQTIKMILDINKKKISIKTLLGYKFRDKYLNIIIPYFVIWIIQSVIAVTVYNNIGENPKFTVIHFMILLLIFVIDTVFMFSNIMYNQHKKTSSMIKES